jgi:hypothetical protein
MRFIAVIALCLALPLAIIACEDERRPANGPTNPDAPFQPPSAKNEDQDAGPPLTGTCVSDSDCTWRGYVCLREPKATRGTCVRYDPLCPPTFGGPQPCQGQDPQQR